jgi:hypothetical protein
MFPAVIAVAAKCTARVATKGAPAADQSISGEALKDQRRS